MFEKEAEDSFNCKKVLYKWETDKHSYIDGFKDGAEFCYNKAKEIIKKFSEFVNNEVEFDSEHPQEHTDLWNELCEQAEQFLRENE